MSEFIKNVEWPQLAISGFNGVRSVGPEKGLPGYIRIDFEGQDYPSVMFPSMIQAEDLMHGPGPNPDDGLRRVSLVGDVVTVEPPMTTNALSFTHDNESKSFGHIMHRLIFSVRPEKKKFEANTSSTTQE